VGKKAYTGGSKTTKLKGFTPRVKENPENRSSKNQGETMKDAGKNHNPSPNNYKKNESVGKGNPTRVSHLWIEK